jgi:hypothetical protein
MVPYAPEVTFMSISSPWLAVGALLLAAPALAQDSEAADLETLWSIGTVDRDTRELALAPDGYARWQGDPLFVVGRSDPAQDWPYVHPGPHDAWAGGTGHVFTAIFAFDGEAPAERCVLGIELVDTHASAPPRFVVRVNGEEVGQRQLPPGAGDATVFGEPEKGRRRWWHLPVSAEVLQAGENVVEIETLTGSWMLWDALTFAAPKGTTLGTPKARTFVREAAVAPAIVNRPGERLQPLTLEVLHIGEERDASLWIGGESAGDVVLGSGHSILHGLAPAVEEEAELSVELRAGEEVLGRATVLQRPVRDWTIFLMHHTHLDIGFTHTQEDVEKRQMGFLDQVLDLIDETDHYPPEAQFRWLPEGLWAVETARASSPRCARGGSGSTPSTGTR